MTYHNYGTMSTTTASTKQPLTPTHPHPHPIHTRHTAPPNTQTPPDSPTASPLTSQQTALLNLMRRYFALNLRADQARTTIHHQLQQNRYIDVFHGPSYELIQDWKGRLDTAKREYERAEERSRGMLSAGEKEGVRINEGEREVDKEWMESVKRRVADLEELLREIG